MVVRIKEEEGDKNPFASDNEEEYKFEDQSKQDTIIQPNQATTTCTDFDQESSVILKEITVNFPFNCKSIPMIKVDSLLSYKELIDHLIDSHDSNEQKIFWGFGNNDRNSIDELKKILLVFCDDALVPSWDLIIPPQSKVVICCDLKQLNLVEDEQQQSSGGKSIIIEENLPPPPPPPMEESLKRPTKDSLIGKFKRLVTSEKIPLNSNATTTTTTTTLQNNQNLVFSTSLHQICTRENRDIPKFVEEILNYLRRDDSIQEGIFRLSGSQATIKEYRAKIDKGQLIEYKPVRDVHNATGLMKMFLRSLPEPLLTLELYEGWQMAANLTIENKELGVRMLKFLIYTIPKCNFDLLYALISYIQTILIPRTDVTRMNNQNFGTVIGPNILWHHNESRNRNDPNAKSGNLGLSLQSTTLASQICTLFLEHYDYMFSLQFDFGFFALGHVIFDFDSGPDGDNEHLELSEKGHDYTGNEVTFSMREGELVFIDQIQDYLDGWWLGWIVGGSQPRYSLFPQNYIKIIYQLPSSLVLKSTK